MASGYLRMPSVASGTVVFIAEDDLWSVPVSGGVARRLTATKTNVGRPAVSPDGKLVAFSTTDEHHAEVWVMPAAGGPANRVTWLGATAAVRGWTPDGRVVFVSDAGQPFSRLVSAWTVDPSGAPPERLPYGPVHEVSYGPDGGVVVGRNTIDPARWKRYRGGTAGDLWIDRSGDGQFRRLIRLHGNLGWPLWVDDRIYFVSDHEGIGNLYSCRPTGRGLRRHTDHDDYYVRAPATDGERVVYQLAGDLWALDLATGDVARIDVDLASPRAQRNRKFVNADKFLTGVAVHPKGHSMCVETRGKLFSFPLWEEEVHQHGQLDGVRYRGADWVGDGTSIVVVSDEGGADALEVHDADSIGPGRRLDDLDLGCISEVVASPVGRRAAVANHRRELFIVDLDTGAATLVDRSDGGRLADLAWSPDGAWVAYSFGASRLTWVIKLCDVERSEAHQITAAEFRDYQPAWDPSGERVYFLSTRVFDPVYDTLYFDLGFPRSAKPYVVTLRAEDPSPFLPEPRGVTAPPGGGDSAESQDGASKAASNDKDTDGKTPPRVRIDLDGIDARVLPFPVPTGNYLQIAAIDGKVLFASEPIEGALSADVFSLEPATNRSLEMYDFAERKHDTLLSGITRFAVSRDGSTLVYQAGRKLRAVAPGQKPPEGKDHDPPGRASGWIDLGRVRVSVDPGAEWRQMLVEAWRLQRDHFWIEDLSGVDWDRVLDRYLPLVEKVATRSEFSDLMWDMQGELGTSHAYELGGDVPEAPPYRIGHLGADLAWDTRRRRWVVEHVVQGDSWVEGSDSPLRAPGVGVRAGDAVLAVNGRPLDASTPPQRHLVHQARQPVRLTVSRSNRRGRRDVVVHTLESEVPARYREWVTSNRQKVHEASDGRVGYVHVPDMTAPGYAEFHRDFFAEMDRDALVVDARFNSGGHVSELILEKLARRRIGFFVSRWEPPSPYPAESPAGPLVALTNEMAGSDGDIFTHGFKLMGLGPVVGKRTWGGVIGISPRHLLVDGSIVTQPEHAFWFADVGWGVENYGTDPDYDVDITPQDHAAGADPQLDRAVELALRALRRHRPLRPDLSTRARLGVPPLPPRDNVADGNGRRPATQGRSRRAKGPRARL